MVDKITTKSNLHLAIHYVCFELQMLVFLPLMVINTIITSISYFKVFQLKNTWTSQYFLMMPKSIYTSILIEQDLLKDHKRLK